jgi:hypothetical protein
MGVASNVDSFDGASPQPLPVRTSVPKGANATADAAPSATGAPPLAKFNAAAATGAVTLQALDTRPTSSSGKGPSAPQHFKDGVV